MGQEGEVGSGVGRCRFFFFFLIKTTTTTTRMSLFFTLGVSSPETQQGQSKEGNNLQLQGGKHYLVAQAPVLTSFGRFHNYFSEELYASLEKYLASGRVRSEKKKGVCVSVRRYF